MKLSKNTHSGDIQRAMTITSKLYISFLTQVQNKREVYSVPFSYEN